jgi:hypothetical protein
MKQFLQSIKILDIRIGMCRQSILEYLIVNLLANFLEKVLFWVTNLIINYTIVINCYKCRK